MSGDLHVLTNPSSGLIRPSGDSDEGSSALSVHDPPHLTFVAAPSGEFSDVDADAGLGSLLGQLVNGDRRDDEPRSDSHGWKGVLMNRAIEGVLVASEDLCRFPHCVEQGSPRDLIGTDRDHLLSNRIHEAK